MAKLEQKKVSRVFSKASRLLKEFDIELAERKAAQKKYEADMAKADREEKARAALELEKQNAKLKKEDLARKAGAIARKNAAK